MLSGLSLVVVLGLCKRAGATLHIMSSGGCCHSASPRANVWCGPTTFALTLNSSDIVASPLPLHMFCGPSTPQPAGGQQLRNRTALVGMTGQGVVVGCSIEEAFLGLSATGARAALVYIIGADTVPGSYWRTRGWDDNTARRAASERMPLVQISATAAAKLLALAGDAAEGGTIVVTVEPDATNPWEDAYSSWSWNGRWRWRAPVAEAEEDNTVTWRRHDADRRHDVDRKQAWRQPGVAESVCGRVVHCSLSTVRRHAQACCGLAPRSATSSTPHWSCTAP